MDVTRLHNPANDEPPPYDKGDKLNIDLACADLREAASDLQASLYSVEQQRRLEAWAMTEQISRIITRIEGLFPAYWEEPEPKQEG